MDHERIHSVRYHHVEIVQLFAERIGCVQSCLFTDSQGSCCIAFPDTVGNVCVVDIQDIDLSDFLQKHVLYNGTVFTACFRLIVSEVSGDIFLRVFQRMFEMICTVVFHLLKPVHCDLSAQ